MNKNIYLCIVYKTLIRNKMESLNYTIYKNVFTQLYYAELMGVNFLIVMDKGKIQMKF